jgi:hypothetical protein
VNNWANIWDPDEAGVHYYRLCLTNEIVGVVAPTPSLRWIWECGEYSGECGTLSEAKRNVQSAAECAAVDGYRLGYMQGRGAS